MNADMIRELTLDDVPNIVDSLKNEAFDCSHFKDFWTLEELQRWILSTGDLCIGYFRDDKLIGFCLSHTFENINKVYLENVYVEENYRKQGIGTALLKTLVKLYLQLYHTRVLRFVALVETTNTNAVKVLKGEGFDVGYQMFWVQKNCIGSED